MILLGVFQGLNERVCIKRLMKRSILAVIIIKITGRTNHEFIFFWETTQRKPGLPAALPLAFLPVRTLCENWRCSWLCFVGEGGRLRLGGHGKPPSGPAVVTTDSSGGPAPVGPLESGIAQRLLRAQRHPWTGIIQEHELWPRHGPSPPRGVAFPRLPASLGFGFAPGLQELCGARGCQLWPCVTVTTSAQRSQNL